MRARGQVSELHLIFRFELGCLSRADAAGVTDRLFEDTVEIDVGSPSLRALKLRNSTLQWRR